MSCTVLEHKPHNVVSLEKSTLDAKDEVENLLKKVNERVETISAEIDVAVAQSQDITAREEACKSQIEAFFTQLQEKIDAEKQKMLAKTASAAEYRNNQVEAPKKVLDLALSMCQNGVNFAKHSLENGNDVQLLNIKPTITQYLVNLKNMGDEVIPKVEHPIQFLKSESSIELCVRLIRDICSVEEVAVCPEKCEAKFLDPTVKVGKRSVIVVTCKDKDGWIITSGCEKDLIQPTFTGVQVEDIEISENRNGTHEISFLVNELGTLQFEAKIKGVAAPSCSLEAEVKWELSAVHGSGYLRMNGQMVMINCLSGEGDVGKYCFRLGDTPMTSGAHHWKVEVSYALEGAEECFHDTEGPTFGVGVVEAGDDYSEASIVHEVTKNWIYSGQAEKITNVVLNLDMGKQSLEILPGRKGLVATSKFSFLRKVFHVNADVVFPFFAVNCPHCSLVVHFGK
ncbi:Hypothetical predicted protein [Paramuricea clavata]|uniref:Uncharacterized protein n=1 Tax=Paramuricea clavata TaxID=317549 RepID=A0A7D9I5V5_PARCT|nr:Hypothetical predicted protein [Paramuricea clavata]